MDLGAGRTVRRNASKHPRDRDAPGLLAGFATTATGQYELSVEAGNKSVALDPDATLAYNSAAASNMYLGRLAEAEATIQRALDRRLDSPDFLLLR